MSKRNYSQHIYIENIYKKDLTLTSKEKSGDDKVVGNEKEHLKQKKSLHCFYTLLLQLSLYIGKLHTYIIMHYHHLPFSLPYLIKKNVRYKNIYIQKMSNDYSSYY